MRVRRVSVVSGIGYRFAQFLLLLCILLVNGGCASIRTNLGVTRALRETVTQRTSDVESSRAALMHAISRRDYARLGEWLSDSAVLVLPGGETLRSGPAIVSALGQLDVESVSFDDVDGAPCQDGAFESGTYILARRKNLFAPASVSAGDYTIHWTTTESGLRVDRIALFAQGDKRGEGYRPCASLRSALVMRSRYAISLVPLAGQFDYATKAGLRTRAEAEGWLPSDPPKRSNDPQPPRTTSHPANGFITLHANLMPLAIEASAALLPVTGGFFGFNETFDSGLTQRFETREAYLVFSLVRGGHRFGLGPALASTKLISMEERMGRFFPGPERWPTTATSFYLGPYESRTTGLGLMTQYMFRKANRTNTFMEIGVRYRLLSGKSAAVHSYQGGSVSQSGAFGMIGFGRAF